MSEMVERVALAIYVAEIGGPEGWNHPRVEAGKERWFAKARAAIEAMSEPTNEMLDFGQKIYTETSDVRDAYVAMVHTAFSRDFPY